MMKWFCIESWINLFSQITSISINSVNVILNFSTFANLVFHTKEDNCIWSANLNKKCTHGKKRKDVFVFLFLIFLRIVSKVFVVVSSDNSSDLSSNLQDILNSRVFVYHGNIIWAMSIFFNLFLHGKWFSICFYFTKSGIKWSGNYIFTLGFCSNVEGITFI